jgi:hypothetical protein
MQACAAGYVLTYATYTDSDKRQTHPLVREGAPPPKDKTEIVKK